ncbi:MAG: FAD-binding protein, partial [Nitrospinae bacterium]|nr:FAD-binding protein [Nitrospinota bacterium]
MTDREHLLPPQLLGAQLAWVRGQRWVHAPMARYTSLRVGGPADVLLVPADVAELLAIVAWAWERHVPLMCLGNGSNLIVRSGGIRGVVVSLREALDHLSMIEPCAPHGARVGEHVRLRAGAGVRLTRLLHASIQEGLTGLAFAVGIPGTIGGAIVMNAGTEMGSIWDAVESVRLLLPDGQTVEVGPSDVPVGYRFARLPERSVVLEATLHAVQGEVRHVRDEARELYHRRRESQPLAQPNAGSIFKNPQDERAGRLIDQLGL